MIQHIGNNFGSKVKLNIFPGLTLPAGVWQVNISFVSYDHITHMTTHSSSSYMTNGRHDDFQILVGSDVYEIDFNCHRLAGAITASSNYYRFSMRVDRLILLNLAHRLLKHRL